MLKSSQFPNCSGTCTAMSSLAQRRTSSNKIRRRDSVDIRQYPPTVSHPPAGGGGVSTQDISSIVHVISAQEVGQLGKSLRIFTWGAITLLCLRVAVFVWCALKMKSAIEGNLGIFIMVMYTLLVVCLFVVDVAFVTSVSTPIVEHLKMATKDVRDVRHLAKHREKAIVFLAIAFNMVVIALGVQTLFDILVTLIFSRNLILVVGAFLLLVAVIWSSALLCFQIWYRHSKWARLSPSSKRRESSVTDFDRVPWMLKSWSAQVLHHLRLKPQNPQADAQLSTNDLNNQSSLDGGNIDQELETQEKKLIMKLLIEAMNHYSNWVPLRVLTTLLLFVTYGVTGFYLTYMLTKSLFW